MLNDARPNAASVTTPGTAPSTGPATAIEPVNPAFLKSLREHVHDRLRKAIIAGRFRPEQRLNERQLATDLGVSTTPLKEALRRLETEGLVRIESRRGVYVTFTAAQAEEMALARAALESMIARLAARRATPAQHAALDALVDRMGEAARDGEVELLIELNERFHGGIHVASGCGHLTRLLAGQGMYDHATRMTLLDDEAERRESFGEHRSILHALRGRDPDRAERAMRDHIVRSGQKHVAIIFAAQEKAHEGGPA